MGYHKYCFTVLSFLAGTLSSAQTDAFDAALVSASELLGSRTTLLMDASGHLVFIQHDDYDVVRKDRIAITDIDVEGVALGTKGTILIACLEGRPRCAQSIIYRSDQEVRSSVLRIPAPLDPTLADSAFVAIRSVLKNFGDVASMQNETSTQSLRSNGTHTNAIP